MVNNKIYQKKMKIHCNLFAVDIYIYYKNPISEIKKFSPNCDNFIDDKHVGCVLTLETGDYIVCFFEGFEDKIYTTIYHEAFHLTAKILSDKGIKLTNESEELFAYYQNYLVKKIIKKIESIKRKS